MAMSATSSVSTSGVFASRMPRRFTASTSMESTPTPKCEIMRSFGSFASVASSMPCLPEVAAASMRPASEARRASRSGASHSLCVV